MWHIYSAGALVSCVLCALVAATWMRVTYVPHESLNSCSPLFAWLAGRVGQFVIGLHQCVCRAVWRTSVVCKEQCCVKYKYICICIGSPASIKRGLEVSAVWDGSQKKCVYLQKIQTIMTMKYANLFHIWSPTVRATPYAERKNIVKAHLAFELIQCMNY